MTFYVHFSVRHDDLSHNFDTWYVIISDVPKHGICTYVVEMASHRQQPVLSE